MEIILSPARGIYIPALEILVISDLHLGKTAHFRKHGIPVTAEIMQSDLQRLARLIREFNPKKIVVVGDMFHHTYNHDVSGFSIWRKSFHHIEFLLIAGNHDRLLATHYEALQIKVEKEWSTGSLLFIHEKPAGENPLHFISGHIHPGVVLSGRARQYLKVPCFIIGENYIILPAFSEFTGLDTMSGYTTNSRVFAIAQDQLVEV